MARAARHRRDRLRARPSAHARTWPGAPGRKPHLVGRLLFSGVKAAHSYWASTSILARSRRPEAEPEIFSSQPVAAGCRAGRPAPKALPIAASEATPADPEPRRPSATKPPRQRSHNRPSARSASAGARSYLTVVPVVVSLLLSLGRGGKPTFGAAALQTQHLPEADVRFGIGSGPKLGLERGQRGHLRVRQRICSNLPRRSFVRFAELPRHEPHEPATALRCQ